MSVYARYFKPEWMALMGIERDTDIGLYALKKLSENQEKALKLTEEELAKDMADWNIKFRNTESAYDIFERDEMIIDGLRQQQRYTMCLSVFSFFEGKLQAVCKLVEQNITSLIKLQDLSSMDNLKRYDNYLTKVFELNLKPLEQYYTPIITNKPVRNIIAHHDGWTKDNKLENQIPKNIGFNQEFHTEEYRILLTPEYITYLIDKVELYLFKLFEIIYIKTKC